MQVGLPAAETIPGDDLERLHLPNTGRRQPGALDPLLSQPDRHDSHCEGAVQVVSGPIDCSAIQI